MSDNSNHIKTFTAEDIRNYWSGKMSPQEMHALEKASLDDPFLADALEGYAAVDSKSAGNDIEWLRNNLHAAEKEERKAVPFFRQSWIRVAAAIIVIGGIGILSYFVFSPENNREVAQTKTVTQKEQPTEHKEDTAVHTLKDTSANYFKAPTEQKASGLSAIRQQQLMANRAAKKALPPPAATEQIKALNFTSADVTVSSPAVSDSVKLARIFSDADELKKEKAPPVASILSAKASGLTVEAQANKAVAQNFSIQNNNISGRITNSKNEPIAGAVVKSGNLNNFAVSDKNGFFSFPVTDTAKNQMASINSIGYASANVALNANVQNNIKLEENKAALNDVVVVGYGGKKKSTPLRAAAVSTVDTLQPAPVDGWEDYYNYVQKSTESFPDFDGEIIVRFEVDKKGKPNNIVVEKSLTDAADKEAIRIIKEGPDWKANSKKKKVRLTIKF